MQNEKKFTSAGFIVFALCAFHVPASAYELMSLPAPCATPTIRVTFTPSQAKTPNSLNSIVQSGKPGTEYIFTPGTYRLQSIEPQDCDQFVGQADAAGNLPVLSGATVLSMPAPSPSPFSSFKRVVSPAVWEAVPNPSPAAAWSITETSPDCLSSNPMCFSPNDLFVDSQPYHRVEPGTTLTAGEWSYNPSNRELFIPAAGFTASKHLVEVSTAPVAFFGGAKSVTIKNLIVEKYATANQIAAIGGQACPDPAPTKTPEPVSYNQEPMVESYCTGPAWTVSNVEARLNHAIGISVESFGTIEHSYAHDNGEGGISAHHTSANVISNEISHNNIFSFLNGGNKLSASYDLNVSCNFVHNNLGPGLWTDTDNMGTEYKQNIIASNNGPGIMHEVSNSAVMTENVLLRNIQTSSPNWGGAQIFISNSGGVTMSDNVIDVDATYGSAIEILNGNRGVGTYGIWSAINNTVNGNTIIYDGASYINTDPSTGKRSRVGGLIGFAVSYAPPTVLGASQTIAQFYTSSNTNFSSNSYYAPQELQPDGEGLAWNWNNAHVTFAEFTSSTAKGGDGKDAKSTFETTPPKFASNPISALFTSCTPGINSSGIYGEVGSAPTGFGDPCVGVKVVNSAGAVVSSTACLGTSNYYAFPLPAGAYKVSIAGKTTAVTVPAVSSTSSHWVQGP